METIIFYSVLAILLFTFLFELGLSILNYKNRNAPIPEVVSDVYNQEEYQKWLSYKMENFRINLFSQVLSFMILIGLLIFGVFPKIYTLSEQLSSSIYARILILLGFYYLVEFIIGIFFSYYRRFNIEERYGFNKSTIPTFVFDQFKSLLLTIIIGGGIIGLLSYLFYNVDKWFYSVAWGSLIIMMILVNLLYVKIFIPLFNKLSPLEEGELKEQIIHFAGQVGYEIKKISVIDASKRSTKLNAFFTGLGKFKQVVLYDTLIDKMTKEQIISVLAHEIGHSKRNHLLKNLMISMITISIYLVVLLFSVQSDFLSVAFGFKDANFAFGIIMFSVIISPISVIIGLVTNYISRKFEFEADCYAVNEGFKEAMIQSLKVLARENYANLTPHPLYVSLKYSHPPIAIRIQAIKNK